MATAVEINSRPLLILGTRTLAEEVADVASEIPGIRVAGFVENMDRSRCTAPMGGLPVHWIDDLDALASTHAAICGIATTMRSRFTDQVDALGMPFAKLVHPTAHISDSAELLPGTFVGAGVVIASHTRLGAHVFVNRGVLIGHHTRIGNFVTIQPGANIAGVCNIGAATYVGMSAAIIDHTEVGSHSVIGAGAVVIENIPDHVLAVGVPAKIVKKNITGK
jgi:sugar O-acyltransferase (sialic acid O-acetyltransferase NeuD family)